MADPAMAKKMLEKALDTAEKSMQYFEWCQEGKYANPEISNCYWANSRELDGKAEAYLDCYEMITGRKVLNLRCDIKEELENCF